MIKRLRVKFIAINMALVGLVLIIVFAAICISSYQQQKADSYRAMLMVLERDLDIPIQKFIIGHPRPATESGHFFFPVVGVGVDLQGQILEMDEGQVDVDEQTVRMVIEEALENGALEGIVRSLNLRYMIRPTEYGYRIAFADRSMEQASLRNLFLMLALVGLGGMLAFFFISVFLSRWALRPVQRVWAQQQQFVADASHELRTPLTVILANLDILRAQPESTLAAQAKWLDNTQTEAVHMKKLVDDLLFLARSDAASLQATPHVFPLSDLVWGCVLLFEPVAFELGVSLLSEVQSDLSLRGDEAQLRQLVHILLDNACKFAGKKGAVSLRLQCVQEHAVLTVANTGATIDAADLPHIFERFYRADKARAHTQGGYGLGLSIAERISAAHDGKISVTSDALHGTVFTVQLPLSRERQPREAG